MSRLKHFFILIGLVSTSCFACLNGETKTLKNGAFVYEDHRGIIPYGHQFFNDNYPKLIKSLDSLYQKTKDLDYLSDKGYVLIIQKKYKEALELYLKIEQIEPNRYSTASNIGTIYELIGDNQNALKWIKKAVQLNPKSHESSEWLHVKILEAKIGGDKYINSRFLINTSFGEEIGPKNAPTKSERERLIKSLYYQLNERVSFIKGKDKIIALLLFDLANLAVLDGKKRDALVIYKEAKKYGLESELIEQRIYYVEWKIEESFHQKIDTLTNLVHNRNVALKRAKNSKENYQAILTATVITASIIIVILLLIIFRIKKSRN